ncbi:MAG: phosphoribosyl-ATP diphosphatase [Acidobacteriota bacterium]|nr:phosphoribosyl-ATP diphosphatase [Acidobacteriota bacterium]
MTTESEVDLGWLWQVLAERRDAGDLDSSYTARLLDAGPDRIAQKVGEEATETIIAGQRLQRGEAREEVIGETADLVYHLFVYLLALGVDASEVVDELKKRHES